MIPLQEFLSRIDPSYASSSDGFLKQHVDATELLKKLALQPQMRTVLILGFHLGYSSEILLQSNPNLHLVILDEGNSNLVFAAKKYLDMVYPNRHTLILGDIQRTLPKFTRNNSDRTFDMILLDDGHCTTYHLHHSRRLAHADTLVVMNKVRHTELQPWNEWVQRGWIHSLFQYDFTPTHSIAYGKYLLPNCEFHVCSLMRGDRVHILQKNRERYPYLQLFDSVNGYDTDKTTEEFNRLNVPYHMLSFPTFGTLANWITKFKMLEFQVQHKIPYLCMLEDDLLIQEGFDVFVYKHLSEFQKDPTLNIIRLDKWGEGYITSYDSAQRILQHLRRQGVVENIDNQFRVNIGKELHLPNSYFSLQVGTNKGDCLKTKRIKRHLQRHGWHSFEIY